MPFILHRYIGCSETPDTQEIGGILYQVEMPPPLPDVGIWAPRPWRKQPWTLLGRQLRQGHHSHYRLFAKDTSPRGPCDMEGQQRVRLNWRETHINGCVTFVKKQHMLAGRLCPQFPVLQKGATKMVS